jgi:hypothetical protein
MSTSNVDALGMTVCERRFFDQMLELLSGWSKNDLIRILRNRDALSEIAYDYAFYGHDDALETRMVDNELVSELRLCVRRNWCIRECIKDIFGREHPYLLDVVLDYYCSYYNPDWFAHPIIVPWQDILLQYPPWKLYKTTNGELVRVTGLVYRNHVTFYGMIRFPAGCLMTEEASSSDNDIGYNCTNPKDLTIVPKSNGYSLIYRNPNARNSTDREKLYAPDTYPIVRTLSHDNDAPGHFGFTYLHIDSLRYKQ